jgi:HSP20 family protein
MPAKRQTEGAKSPHAAAPKSAPRSAPRSAGETGPKFSAGAKAGGAAGGGAFGIDNLFAWLGGVVEQLGEAVEKTKEGELVKHGEFKVHGLGEKARGVYGVSVKMGLGGEPAFQSFGNIHPTAKGPEVSEVREPLVDVFDEDKEVLVVAELPGATEKDIAVTVKDGTLTLEANGKHRYAKDVELPAKVKSEPVRKVYRNGLLEVRFAKI